MLDRREIEAIRAGTFHLDALHARLVRRGSTSDVFTGSGYVKQTPEGQLEYRIYDPERVAQLESPLFAPAGALIRSEDFYDLDLRDWRGREWRAEKTLPDTSGVVGKPGVVCTGRITELRVERATAAKDYLWLFVRGKYRMPSNEGTKIITKAGGQEAGRFDPNLWRVAAPSYTFIATRSDDGLEIGVAPISGSLPVGFDSRLEEALWFALAIPAYWEVLDERRGGRQRLLIRARRARRVSPRLQPPLEPEHGPRADHIGEMAVRYLAHVSNYRQPRYHPLSVKWLQVLQASAVSLEAEALALAVAVEGTVSREFKALGKPDSSFRSEVRQALKHIESWAGPDALKRRICQNVSMFVGTNAREALNRLVENAVITPAQLAAWNSLRQRLAHGRELSAPIEELIRLSDMTHAALLRITFAAIGYSGEYTDRTKAGWPVALFPDAAPTSQDSPARGRG